MTSSARRALRILEVVNSSTQPMGVSAIAEAVDTLPGTAFRSLDALERCDFVARYRASTQYEVGAAARRLGQTVHAQFAIRNLAMPFLRRLAYAAGETVTLTVPAGWFSLRLAVIDGSRALRSAAPIGLAGVLADDVAGRAILATYDAEAVQRFATGIPGPERDLASLTQTLDEVRSCGYSVEQSIDDPAHSAVAFAVRHHGIGVAAIGIDGPVIGTGPSADWAAWRSIIADLERQIEDTPDFRAGPFAHLDATAVTRMLAGQSASD